MSTAKVGSTNGDGGSKWMDLLSKVFSNNPALLAAVLFVLWSSGRIETPEEKKVHLAPMEMRIESLSREIQELKSELKTHRELGGHLEMEFRMRAVEKHLNDERTSAGLD